jgi:predicted HTH domain antitoxin
MTSKVIVVSDADKLVSIGDQLANLNQNVRILRRHRNELFLKLYSERAMTVTMMASLAGIGREAVHDVLKKERDD